MGLGIAVSDDVLFFPVALILLLALAMALVVSKRRTGFLITPVTLFFLFAVAHALFGWYTAFLTARYTSVGPATLEPFIYKSFLILATGLTCAFCSYSLIRSGSRSRISGALARLSSLRSLDQICARSRILILIGVPLIIIGLQQLGGIPLISDNVRQDRYLLNFLPEYRFDAFLVNRGREMIVIPTAALVLAWFFRRRAAVDILFVGLAVAGCLLTATRSPILIGLLFVLMVLVWRRRINAVVLTVAILSGGLIGSEVALGDASPIATEGSTMERIGADLGEVRDLGWVLAKQQDFYWGRTFLAGLIPLPSFASDFTDAYHLRTITLSTIGYPLTAAHGGLRITYTGECYLNFGWPGVIGGGLFYGWMCSKFSHLFHFLRAGSSKYPVGAYLLTCAWVGCSFMVYLSGSATFGTLKTYSAVLFALCAGLSRSSSRRAVEPVLFAPMGQGERVVRS
jgi:hypothetical protein